MSSKLIQGENRLTINKSPVHAQTILKDKGSSMAQRLAGSVHNRKVLGSILGGVETDGHAHLSTLQQKDTRYQLRIA